MVLLLRRKGILDTLLGVRKVSGTVLMWTGLGKKLRPVTAGSSEGIPEVPEE